MPASKPAAPAAAVSSDQAREEHRALLNHHMGKIRLASQAVDLARAPYDAARDDLTAVIDEARADLGKKKYPRKRLMGYLEDLGARLRNLLAEEQQRHQDRIDLGLPVHGEQLALALSDPSVPEEARDELAWEAEGFLLGRQGKINIIPDGCPPRFHQTVMAAAIKGQELTQAAYLVAKGVIASRGQPDAGVAPKDLNAEAPEPGTPAAKKAERAAIAAAKAGLDKLGEKGGEAKPEGDGFEASPAELAAQTGRQSTADRREGRTSGEATGGGVNAAAANEMAV